MRHFSAWILVVFLGASILKVALAEPADYKGDIIPVSDFAVSDYLGEVLYLDFWAYWCAPCYKSFPWMETMKDKYEDEGLSIVAVSVDGTIPQMHEFLDKVGGTLKVVHDPKGTLAAKYDLLGLPSSIIFDRQGDLRINHAGFRTRDTAKLEEHIQHHLQE